MAATRNTITVVLTLFFASSIVHSVLLDADREKYVLQILEEFEKDRKSSRFDNVIHPPNRVINEERRLHSEEMSQGDAAVLSKKNCFLPKTFVWCPLMHYGYTLRCPEHGRLLEVGEWTNILTKLSVRNPRLVYDIGGNVILIQRIYWCKQPGLRHFYLSASKMVMQNLPRFITTVFPFKIYHRAGCTKNLIDTMESLVFEGVNFLRICETIASLNYKSYCHRGEVFLSLQSLSNTEHQTLVTSFDDFYDDILYSFPSTSLLTYMYLEHFQELKPFYEHEMSKLKANIISCDHTFKVSKNIGAFRKVDGHFVEQFENLFIVLNENKEVIEWRLTKSCGFEEIKDLIENVKFRQEPTPLECVFIDDCCKYRRLYQSILGDDVPVKLDLFHAVQRITSSIPRGTEFSKQVSKEFGLVFRQNGDFDDQRSMPTPEISVIKSNIDTFVNRWGNVFGEPELQKTLYEIEKLKGHVDKGCLSGIQPGEGTQGNEGLHRILNRSLLCGSSVIGPELAIAILTALFYGYNSKRKGERHIRNAKVTPVKPIESHAAISTDQGHGIAALTAAHIKLKETCENALLDNVWTANTDDGCNSDDGGNSASGDAITIADQVEHLFDKRIAKSVIEDATQLDKVLSNLNSGISNKSVNAYDFLFGHGISEYNKLSSSGVDSTNNVHYQNLLRNLSSLGLSVDHVSGDGDCAFKSIVRQLHKLTDAEKNDLLVAHLEELDLNKCEDEDAFQLRQLFVNHVQSKEHYQMLVGIPQETLNEETELFREEGTFCGNLGGLVIKVSSDILRIPILVITSLPEHQYVPFIPDGALVSTSLCIAYNSHGAGHYDGVCPCSDLNQDDTNVSFCSCGKNKGRGDVSSCKTESCPCIKGKVSCTRRCRCRNCLNMSTLIAPPSTRPIKPLSCRCGERTETTAIQESCKDGKKKSKCPCLANGQGCSSSCRCHNCGNLHGLRPKQNLITSPGTGKKRKRSCPEYKRPNGYEFLAGAGFQSSPGPWTNFESSLLASVVKFLSITAIVPSGNNISKLYNYVIAQIDLLPLKLSKKTSAQVMAKLAHLGKKQEVLNVR